MPSLIGNKPNQVPTNGDLGTMAFREQSQFYQKTEADALLANKQDASTTLTTYASTGVGFRNRIINGDMRIDQRNAGASVTPANGAYTLDRWASFLTQSSKYTVQQNAGAVTPPVGFSNYLGVTSSSAYSVLTADTFFQYQMIEGFNFADMAWGTANASAVTLSFWVRSSLTGSFGGALTNSAANRSYPFSYTINAANTWEQKTITVAGDTSGTWVGATNGIGVIVRFGLGSGATFSGTSGAWAAGNIVQPTGTTSVVGTNGATFYITGVQLEAGTVASPFERRDYGRELMMCQRYYEKSYNTDVVPGTATANGMLLLPTSDQPTDQYVAGSQTYRVEKRATATMSYWDIAGNASRSSIYTAAALVRTDNNNNVNTIAGTTGGIYVVVLTAAGNFPALQWVASAEL